MNPIRKIATTTLLALILGGSGTPARAGTVTGATQTTPARTPTATEPRSAQSLLDSMTQALGGREAIARVRSLSTEAVCSGPGGQFTTQLRSIRGEGTYFRQAIRDTTTEIWSTTERTWSIGENGAPKDHPAAVRSFVRGHEFHLLIWEIGERFSRHRATGMDTVGGQPGLRIDMIDDQEKPAALWLDPETDLPLALEVNPDGAAGPVRVFLDDWASLEDLQIFRSFDLTEGEERSFSYDFVAIDLNPSLESLFEIRAHQPNEQNEEREREAIEEILRSDREAHLKTDAALIGAHLADTLVEVSDGAINTRTREEVVDFFEASFRGATFHGWDDTQPPIVRLSPDLSMAWVIRRITADREDMREGPPVRTRYTSAYTATYERLGGRWSMTSVTSTFLVDGAGV